LVANALVDRGLHLSTDLTPHPSFHFKSIPARFLFLSFRQPGTGLYYKGRECVPSPGRGTLAALDRRTSAQLQRADHSPTQ
jgi:hypothetical protein